MKDKEKKDKEKEKAKLKKAPVVERKSKRLKKPVEDDEEEPVELDVEVDEEEEEEVEEDDEDSELDALDDDEGEEESVPKGKAGKAGKAPRGKPGKRPVIDLEDVEPELDPDEEIGELEEEIIVIPKPRSKRAQAALDAEAKNGEDPSKPQSRLGLIRARHEAIRREIDQIREDLESDEEE